MKKNLLVSSIVTIVLCLSVIAGATFALFTSNETINIAVTSGNVEVTAVVSGLKTWSLNQTEADADTTNGTFVNGGSASFSEGTLSIERMTPGDVAEFTIDIKNKSDVKIQYKITATSSSTSNPDLMDALTFTAVINGVKYEMNKGEFTTTDWLPLDANGVIEDIEIVVEFPNGTPANDNLYKGKNTKVTFTVEAVQGNGRDTNGNLILPQ